MPNKSGGGGGQKHSLDYGGELSDRTAWAIAQRLQDATPDEILAFARRLRDSKEFAVTVSSVCKALDTAAAAEPASPAPAAPAATPAPARPKTNDDPIAAATVAAKDWIVQGFKEGAKGIAKRLKK